MSIIGKSISINYKQIPKKILLFISGNVASNTISSTSGGIVVDYAEHFSWNANNEFGCNITGTYRCRVFAKGCYTSYGNRVEATAYLYVYHNGSWSEKISVASNSTYYTNSSWTDITLYQGDIVQLRGKNNTSGSTNSVVVGLQIMAPGY